MRTIQSTVSPVDGSVFVERPLATWGELDGLLARADDARFDWRNTPLATRIVLLSRAIDAFVAKGPELSSELTWQMGRPISQTPGEIRGFEERARTMLALAPEALADVATSDKAGFTRWIRREPLGTVLVLSPWNYPYLTAVNAVWPALAAGNTVVLKHSSQTPLCAERFAEALAEAGVPEGVFGFVHASHDVVARSIADPRVSHVAFTGSVDGGRATHLAGGSRFIAMGLELGGKDPAYVRADADLDHAVENVVDGVYYNSGQSCCGVERVYVHRDLHDRFVDGFVDLVKQYRLGNPTESSTNLGPMVRGRAADLVRRQVAEAVASGARALVDPGHFAAARETGPYLAPQVLVDVHHGMAVMTEESFGPVVGIMPVDDDEEAMRLMNDSRYGLTASIWTTDMDAAARLGDRLDTGTVYANRCDYLDPELAWVGVKDSGRGCTLSKVGYEHLTRPKSFHLRHR